MIKINKEKIEYAVGVVFKQGVAWSKPYTYKSLTERRRGDIVIVPTGNFYSVGTVIGCTEEYTFDPKINYKFIIESLEDLNKEEERVDE